MIRLRSLRGALGLILLITVVMASGVAPFAGAAQGDESEAPAYEQNKIAVLFNERFFETNVMAPLAEANLQLIEPSLIRRVQQEQPSLIQAVYQRPQPRVYDQLAPLFEAHILVVGTVSTETFQNDYGFISATANVEIRVVSLAEARILATRTFSATDAGGSQQAARSKAYQLVLNESETRLGLSDWLLDTLKSQPALPDPVKPTPQPEPSTTTTSTSSSEQDQNSGGSEKSASSSGNNSTSTGSENSQSSNDDQNENANSSSNSGADTKPAASNTETTSNPNETDDSSADGAVTTTTNTQPPTSPPATQNPSDDLGSNVFAMFTSTIVVIAVVTVLVIGIIAVVALRRPQSVSTVYNRGDTVEIQRQGQSRGSSPDTKRCPNCGQSFPNNFKYCTQCENQELIER